MKKKLRTIMLIDDNDDDKFYHQREINKYNQEISIITMETAMDALKYFKTLKEYNSLVPDLIFLDINMPCMDGWEFLQEYNNLDNELLSTAVIIMLTTSNNPDDIRKTTGWNFVADFSTKPLTKEKLEGIIKKFLLD